MRFHAVFLLIWGFSGVLSFAGEDPPRCQGEEWLQFKFDSRHSGNVPDRTVAPPLGLLAAMPLTDAVFTAPVVADGKVYVVDGSGVAFCLDALTLKILWKVPTRGGKGNCNNVSSPAVAGNHVHFGTTGGTYTILNAGDGTVAREIPCGEPIFSTPVVGESSVYFATLGSRVFAVQFDGTVRWVWDFVKERLQFEGNRWSGEEWSQRKERVTWHDQFCCSRNIALHGKTLVIPAGGSIVWLEDAGSQPVLRQIYEPKESPSTLGLSLDEAGRVYRQWYRRDNGGAVEILKLADGKVETGFVQATQTNYRGPESMSFSSVSIRGTAVYRCRPEEKFGFCKHTPGAPALVLGEALSIAPPILLARSGIFGGLDGCLYIVPLSKEGKEWSFRTAFGKAISAPPAVCNGRIYFGCEDGYLYALGPEGKSPLPAKDLELWKIRSSLKGKYTDSRYDWHTHFGDCANTNVKCQGMKQPFKIKWIRRFEGTVKHFSVCGGGRMYTHTAEGQIFAVEQETGRLLWRTYFPGVHVSYTTPLYWEERLYLPQAGLERSFLRCLDAPTGKLVWEAPFTGSPSWNRQQPPIIYKGLVFYLFGSGKYTAEKWLFEHQSTFGFPGDHKPLLKAWDRETGKEVWTRDFSEYGAGGDDAGFCLMNDTLYYSCYFGDKDPPGITAGIEPLTGRILWMNKEHSVHAGCTVSGKDGRIYLGGYNPVPLAGKINHVWCLDVRDGSLVWESEPVHHAIHVITIREDTLFTHAQYRESYLLDRKTGKILKRLDKGYRCTRFAVSEPYLLGANLDIYDLSRDFSLVSTGPTLDVLLCVGAINSNGRIFFTTNGGGLQASLAYAEEASSFVAPWEVE